MNFRAQVSQAIDTLIDVCAYYEGTQCHKCEAQSLCACTKPLELLSNTQQQQSTHNDNNTKM